MVDFRFWANQGRLVKKYFIDPRWDIQVAQQQLEE